MNSNLKHKNNKIELIVSQEIDIENYVMNIIAKTNYESEALQFVTEEYNKSKKLRKEIKKFSQKEMDGEMAMVSFFNKIVIPLHLKFFKSKKTVFDSIFKLIALWTRDEFTSATNSLTSYFGVLTLVAITKITECDDLLNKLMPNEGISMLDLLNEN